MKLLLKRLESPYTMALSNEAGHICPIDASPTIGGKNKGFRPMELLAGSLAACASIDVIMILQKKRIILGCYQVDISAERKEGTPSPFSNIHLEFVFANVIDQEVLTKTIEMSLFKYCSVSASLSDEVKITYSYRIES